MRSITPFAAHFMPTFAVTQTKNGRGMNARAPPGSLREGNYAHPSGPDGTYANKKVGKQSHEFIFVQ